MTRSFPSVAPAKSPVPAPAAPPPRGSALLVALDHVDPNHFSGWTGRHGTEGVHHDLSRIREILHPAGFQTATLLSEQATREAVLTALEHTALNARPGDLFVFYFSGHGIQVPDLDGDEIGGLDQCLVAFDGEIVDDELGEIWKMFPEGARIVTVTDCCHAGTIFRYSPFEPFVADPTCPYDPDMRAQLIHFGACRDPQIAFGYPEGGAFTTALSSAWAGGAFEGNYRDLFNETTKRIKTRQQPQYCEFGPVQTEFWGQRPFSLEATACTLAIAEDLSGAVAEEEPAVTVG